MKVFVIGLALLPHRAAGDKNFYLDCFSSAWPEGTEIHVLSFAGRDLKAAQLAPGVWLHEMSRPFHRNEYERYGGTRNGVPYFRHRHGRVRETLERSLALGKAVSKVREISGKAPGLVHYIDNFGPFMAPAAKLMRARGTGISSRPLNWPYTSASSQNYVRLSTGQADVIGASSLAWMDGLGQLGIPKKKIRRQRWGIEVPDAPSPGTRARRRHLIWTGFIPYVRPADFKVAWKAAESLRAANQTMTFQFLFKPTSWREEFAQYARPGIEVGVSTKPFKSALMDADALFSPLGENSILTPPLSWLEAMALEVPVITTNTFGISELISDGVNGFVCQPGESLGGTVTRALESDLVAVGQNARRKVNDEFRLDQCVQDMYDLWSELE